MPGEPGVGGAEDGVAAFCRLTDARHVLEDPLDLAAGEVGGGRQSRFVSDGVAVAVSFQGAGDLVGAGVLPHDRVVVRTSRSTVPDDGGLTLVGDAEGGQVAGRQSCFAERCLDDGRCPLPDLHRVVLNPAGAGKDLLVFELMAGDLVTCVVEDHESSAGGSLVDGTDEIWHGCVSRSR